MEAVAEKPGLGRVDNTIRQIRGINREFGVGTRGISAYFTIVTSRKRRGFRRTFVGGKVIAPILEKDGEPCAAAIGSGSNSESAMVPAPVGPTDRITIQFRDKASSH